MNIFIFNRGLRLYDNTTLIHQTQQYGLVVPIFIFTPEQISKTQNAYFSNNSVQFMIESLHDLEKQISQFSGKLYFFKGDNVTILEQLLKLHKINSIMMNYDYTPYARQRSTNIQFFCKKNNIIFCEKEDYVMHDIVNTVKTTKKKDGTPYLKFTPYKNHCVANLTVRKPNSFKLFKFQKIKELENCTHSITSSEIDKFYTNNKDINVHGGTSNGLKILKNLSQFKNYDKERDILSYKTTFLSAHNHYMTISIREEYWIIKHVNSSLINELYWRQFYLDVGYNFPQILQGQLSQSNHPLNKKYEKIKWSSPLFNNDHRSSPTQSNNDRQSSPTQSNNDRRSSPTQSNNDRRSSPTFDKWITATTGFPIIDASIRQLLKTGFVHNRMRMVAGSFVVKILLIDWRYAEQFYAQHLVDYDPIINNLSWQWVSGSGNDPQPYFRYFNSWTQATKFDKDAIYIKQWLPELKDIPAKDLHKWYDPIIYTKWLKLGIKYCKPMLTVDEYNNQKEKSLKMYQKIYN